MAPYATASWPPFRGCALSRCLSPAVPTGRTTSSRRRWSAPTRTSTSFSREAISPPGSSRSCATTIRVPQTQARDRGRRRAARGRSHHQRRAAGQGRIQRAPRGTDVIAGGAARSADPRWRIWFLLRRGRRNLRLRGRHHQEPPEPRSRPPRPAALRARLLGSQRRADGHRTIGRVALQLT